MKHLKARQKAINIILEPLLMVVSKPDYVPNEDGYIQTVISYKHRFLLLIGKSDSIRLPGLSKKELEDMLNVLRRYSLLSYEYILSGEAFIVQIKSYRFPVAKIVEIKSTRKAA